MSQDRLLQPAKEFLKAYFSDGVKKKPSDFDNEILGGADTTFLFGRPRWDNTVFFLALGELVKEDIIHFKQLEDGQFIYWMPI